MPKLRKQSLGMRSRQSVNLSNVSKANETNDQKLSDNYVFFPKIQSLVELPTGLGHFIYMNLILLLGGDVEKNPGPRTKKTSAAKKRKQNQESKHRAREKEADEQTTLRRKNDKCRKTANRKKETEEQTTLRRKSDKHRKTVNRETETEEQTTLRRQTQKHRTAVSRETETEEHTALRRQTQKRQTVVNRETETEEHTALRRQAQKRRTAVNRETEIEEHTALRRRAQKRRTAVNRETETEEHTALRRQAQKHRTAVRRETETEKQTTLRRQAQKRRTAVNRETESAEKTCKRRCIQKVKTAEYKKTMTKKQKQNLQDNERKRLKESRSVAVDLSKITRSFQENIKHGPDYICTCCHRMMYRQNVLLYKKERYAKMTDDLCKLIIEEFLYKSSDDKTWVCSTCDRTLRKGKMPRQAKANGLNLDIIPTELVNLNQLEIRLISQRIPFMKIVALPRGKQKAIHGPAVNVPTKLDTICNLLPRLPQECEIVPMKLKRRLAYKSHYMYDSVHPEIMMSALYWLIQNNKQYGNVKMNDNWTNHWKETDPDLWQALIGLKVEPEANSDAVRVTTAHNILQQCMAFARSDSFAHLRELCKPEGYSIENVEGDGNCFYRAVAKQLEHCGILQHYHNNHTKLRADLTSYLEANPNGPNGPYKDFLANRAVRGDTEPETGLDKYVEQVVNVRDRAELRWQRYLQDMAQGSWADQIAVQGMADMLHVAIRIISTINPDTPLMKPSDGMIHDMIHLGLIGQLHYVSLVCKTGKNASVVVEINCEYGKLKGTDKCLRKNDEIASESIHHFEESANKNSKEDNENDAEFQQESEAFEASSKLRGLPLDTCMQIENFDVNQIMSVAPGEGSKPLNILTDQFFEEMSFPQKYPYGRYGFSEERQEKVTVRKFFNQRLLDVDGRFAKDVEYLLAAQYAVEHDQVNHLQSIVIRQMSGRLYRGGKLTAAHLKDSATLNQLVQKDHAYRLLKEVRGTPAYWQKVHYEVLAMVRQLGIPTWFLTLSAADMKWPEVIQIIARQYGTILSEEQVSNLSWEEKCNWLKTNPVTVARHFQYRLDLFWNKFLKSKANPVGEVIDYMIRIEFQARGSPHAHTLIWIKDAPKFGIDPIDEVIQFIDKYQTCVDPIDDPEMHDLIKLQSHVHSSSCMKQGSCRFGIPKLPSPQTLISVEPEDALEKVQKVKWAKEIFSCVNDTIKDIDCFDNLTLKELLQVSNISMNDYVDALHTSKRGNTVVLKRKPQEMNINSYNPDVLRAWRANMDIQYITDPYACVMYVSSYMMKAERHMGELLRHVCNDNRGEDIKTQLSKLGSTFLNHREVSAQEASYRILSLPLKRLSRKCVFVNTDPKDERITMTKPLSSIQGLEDEEEDLYLVSLIDRYAARPDQLNGMCLAEFAANYDVKYAVGEDDKDNDHTPNPSEQCENEKQPNAFTTIHLKNGLGKMKKRKHEAIIRFHKYNTEKESEKHFRAKLMLYVPWRQEDDIIGDRDSYYDQYRNCLEQITATEQHYTQNGPNVEQAMEDLIHYGPPVHAFANIAPNAEQQRLEEVDEGVTEETHLEQQDLDDNAQLIQGNRDRGDRPISQRFKSQTDTNLLSSADYSKKMRQLNREQRQIVQYHRKWCKSVVEAVKQKKPIPKAYRCFISGPGGVGKSHVIDLLRNDTIKLLRNLPTVQPEDILCLLCAPTGTAAFNISGMTVHSAFLIPVAMSQYRSLGADTLNTLRNKMANLKVLIIDEISMINSNLFYTIHRRLEDIKGFNGLDSTFGDVTVIAVGDLYQLPPVGNKYVFNHPNDSYARLHDPLWHQFRLAELTQIMRQKDDAEFANLLNRVRTATCSERDIAILKSRQINDNSDKYVNIMHVYSQHKFVDKYNQEMLHKLDTEVYTLKAIDSKKEKASGINIKFPEKARDTGGLEETLKVAIGCRVMLIYNIDVSDGLSNGATGIISHIVQIGNSVVHILVHFDNPEIGSKRKRLSQYRENYPNAVPISRHEATFNIGTRKCVTATRRQFPLTLAWASTIHKVQGMTTDSIVVSFEGKFFPGQAYVALSRVRCLNGLHIIKFDPGQIHADDTVLREMERLQKNPLVDVKDRPTASTKDQKASQLQLSHLNIRGIKSHREDLKMDFLVLQSDVLCFCETFLRNGDKLSGYSFGRKDMKIFRVDRPHHHKSVDQPGSGGILVGVRQDFKPELVARNISCNLEYVAVQINNNNRQLLIISVYRPPGSSVNVFLNEMANVLNDLKAQRLDCIIVGDFNKDAVQSSCPIVNFFESKNFEQKTDGPTRDSGTILDHTYTSAKVNVVSVSINDTYYSDHDFVSIYVS